MDSFSDVAKLSRILIKDNSARLSLLKDASGDFIETKEETLHLLLRKCFPEFKSVDAGKDDSLAHLSTGHWRNRDWKLGAQVVSPYRVRWAFNIFDRYKSPEIDRIFPALLKEGLDQIIGVLVGVLKGCIATRNKPLLWKKVRVVFISKPDKKSYTDAKDFRSISLTLFFLKILEIIVHRFMREGLLKDYPLHEEQHAY